MENAISWTDILQWIWKVTSQYHFIFAIWPKKSYKWYQPIISKKTSNLVLTGHTVFTLSYSWLVPLTDPLSKVKLCEATQKSFISILNPLSTNLNYLSLETSMFTILSFQFQITIWNLNCFFQFFFIITDFPSVSFHIWGKFLVLLDISIDDKVLFFYCS